MDSIKDQLGSADVSQNEYDQILMGDNSSDVVGIGTLRTIDQKKEELRVRNREYQRLYRERKRNEAAGENTREQNLDQKIQMQVGEKKQWPGLVTIFPEPSASIRINGDEANLLNTNEKIRAAMDSLKKQFGSTDGNQKECSQILMGVNASDVVGIGTLGTIDLKKEELRTRNREYQRQYRERKRTQADGDNIVTREQNVDHKHDGTLAKKFERQMQVRQQPETLASISRA